VPDAIAENYYDGAYNDYITYHFPDGWAPTPVSASPSSYPFLNEKQAPSPFLTLKKLEISSDPTSKLSSDDDSLIDSPCYRGRNWSQITPLHMGETSPPPRVTVEKLGEEQNFSVAATQIASLMVSHEKENGLSVPVPMGFLDSALDIGFSGDNPTKQKLDPGMQEYAVQNLCSVK
jgi:hypothetical protein